MPRKPCYWTRKLELDLVDFIRERDFIWRPIGNTNHHIQQKYKAYAEFAAKLGRGFTARSVRDRWVNIRSTFNHNVRRVEKSKEAAATPSDVYVPCWPLWKPLQFLRDVSKKETNYEPNPSADQTQNNGVKEESAEVDNTLILVRQRGHRTNRPRRQLKPLRTETKPEECIQVLDNLIESLNPLVIGTNDRYGFFGRHVVEQLDAMRDLDAEVASREIMRLVNDWPNDWLDCQFET